MELLIFAVSLASAAGIAVLAGLRWASRPTLPKRDYDEGRIAANRAVPGPLIQASGHLRLVTLNAGYASGAANNTAARVPPETTERNLDRLGRALSGLNADFVLLQEVDFDSARSHRLNQLERLRERTGHPHAAWVYNWDVRYLPWPYWPPRAHFGRILSGQALLSRFPILQHRKVTFPKPAMHSSWYNRFFIDRTLHVCTVDLAGRALQLAGCHLESFHIEWRRKQARLLTEALAGLAAGPMILAGDFNAIPDWAVPPPALHSPPGPGEATDDTIAHIAASGLRPFFDAERWSAREEASYTYASFQPVACIDNAFCNGEVEWLDGGVCRDSGDASDHFPVWIDFRLRERV